MSYSYKDAVRPNYNEYMLNYLNQSGYYNGYGFFTCRNPEHNDHKPSMSFNPKNNTIHCFSCGCTYGLVDLVMVDHHLSYSDAVNWIRVNLMGEQPIKSNVTHQTSDFRVFYSELVEDYTYLNKRGINGYLASRMGPIVRSACLVLSRHIFLKSDRNSPPQSARSVTLLSAWPISRSSSPSMTD